MTQFVSLNLQHGLRGRSVAPAQLWPRSLSRVAELRPDIVFAQEVDRFQPRSGNQDQAELLAATLSLPHYRYAAALAGDVSGPGARRASRADDGAAPSYGVMIASRYPILGTWVRSLPAAEVADEPRVLLACLLDTPRGPLAAGSTHLSTRPRQAIRQLQLSQRLVAGLGEAGAALGTENAHPRAKTVVLGGDFNLPGVITRRIARSGPWPPRWQSARARTFPARAATRQIDHLLALGRPSISWRNTRAIRCEISDHRAIGATLDW